MLIPFPSFLLQSVHGRLERRFSMPDIKTRDIAKGTIKTIDKSAVAAERMKSAFIQTKEKRNTPLMSPKAVRRNTLPTVWKAVSTEFPTKPYTNLTSKGARAFRRQSRISSRQRTVFRNSRKTGGAVASKTGADGGSTKRRQSEYQGGGTAEEGSKRVCPFRREKDD